MKTISIRELHASTGVWVREAARVGVVVITDRGKPIARMEGVAADVQVNPFSQRKLRPGYSKLLGKLGGGTDSAAIISGDRDGS